MKVREKMDRALAMANAEALGPYRWRMSKDAKDALTAEFAGQLVADPEVTTESYAGLPVSTVAGAGVYWRLECSGPRGFWGTGEAD